MITPLSKRAAEMTGMEHQLDWRVDLDRQAFGVGKDSMVEIPTVNGMTRCTSTAFSAFPQPRDARQRHRHALPPRLAP